MNNRTFYIKALGLVVIGSMVKVAVRAVSSSISAPTTVVNNIYPQSSEEPANRDLTVVKDDSEV